MTLTNDDFSALDALFDRKLSPIQTDLNVLKTDVSVLKTDVSGLKTLKTELREVKAQIATINEKLDRIEKWLPLDNTYVISPLRKQNPSQA